MSLSGGWQDLHAKSRGLSIDPGHPSTVNPQRSALHPPREEKLGKCWQHKSGARAVWSGMRSRRCPQTYCGKLQLYGRDCMAACCKNPPAEPWPRRPLPILGSHLVPQAPSGCSPAASPTSISHRGRSLRIPADAGETEAAFLHSTAGNMQWSLGSGPLSKDMQWF